ncbi:MAG: N-acetyltransferase [Bacteroidota bacterium]
MEISIRPESSHDYESVEDLVQAAFANEPLSDQSESLLVHRLRNSPSFVPELSLIAEHEGRIIGHILLTEIIVQNDSQIFPGLALAPVSVHPEYQGKGIGSKLIEEAHRRATTLGYPFIVLIGHESYYPRFGYEPAGKYGIEFPFKVPPQNAMVKALAEEGLNGLRGRVQYDKAFFS